MEARGSTVTTTRDLVMQILEQLPEDAALDDIIERLYFVRRLQQRLVDADDAEKLTHDEARERMKRWLT
jgi:hypothetical protein